MKTLIIINARYLELNKNFEKRILKVIPKTIEKLEIVEFDMTRVGTGQYAYKLTFYVDGENVSWTKKVNDSQTWDWYNDVKLNLHFYNWKKRSIVNGLEDYFNSL